MRDPERIPEMLRVLAAIWYTYPDLRLGQLIVNACPAGQDDPFYVEDDVLLDGLKKLPNRMRGLPPGGGDGFTYR